jgi:hypothetical protein
VRCIRHHHRRRRRRHPPRRSHSSSYCDGVTSLRHRRKVRHFSIESNRIESNRIESNRIESNRTRRVRRHRWIHYCITHIYICVTKYVHILVLQYVIYILHS